jgi:hypothetical protein
MPFDVPRHHTSPGSPARTTTINKLPAVLATGSASVDDDVVPASLLACCTEVIVATLAGVSVVTSLPVSLALLVSPPPATVAVFVTLAGALLATSTVKVIGE